MACHCMRVESPKPASGPLGGWIHRLADPLPALNLTALPKKEKPIIDWAVLAQTMFDGGAEERYYLAETLGVKEWALVELGVGRGWDAYRGLPYSSWPERDATGKVVGIVRRYRSGAKKTMQHSSHGLYYAARFLRMRNGPVFMVEGGSDTAATLGLELNVIGRPSNLGGVEMLAQLLKDCPTCNRLVVIGEQDRKTDQCTDCEGCPLCWPGYFGAKETAKRLAQRLHRSVRWIMPPLLLAKDVREWLRGLPDMTGPQFLQAVRKWSHAECAPIPDPTRGAKMKR